LHGLAELVPNYEFAKGPSPFLLCLLYDFICISYYLYSNLDLILDLEVEYKLSPEQSAQVERSAELLYGLIHARFIITPR